MTKFIRRSEINTLVAMLRQLGITTTSITFNTDVVSKLSIRLPITVKINNSDFFFEIGSWEKDYWVKYFPGPKGPAEESFMSREFQTVSAQFSGWAQAVARDLKEPDPLSLLGTNNLIAPELLSEDHKNERISEHQFTEIRKALNEIRRFLAEEIKPDKEHIEAIDEKLDFLEHSAKSQDRKSWMFVAIGVAFTIADGLAMSPEQAHRLFAMFSDLFRHAFLKLLS